MARPWIIAGALWLSGCSASAIPNAPQVSGLQPNVVTPLRATPAVLTGEFLNPLIIDLDDPGSVPVGMTWLVSAGETKLGNVVWRNSTTLDVTIPAGMAPAVYDLVVVSPAGLQTVLAGGLEVQGFDDLELPPVVPYVPPSVCVGGGSPTLVVDSQAAEEDDAETFDPPYMGTGLTLREAITLANNTPGHDCITFTVASKIFPTTAFPELVSNDGAEINGAGGVVIDGVGDTSAVGAGLHINSDNNIITGLEIRNYTAGTSNMAVYVDTGDNNQVLDSYLLELEGPGIQVDAGATNTLVAGNLVVNTDVNVLDRGSGTVIRGNDCRLSVGSAIRVRGTNTTIVMNRLWGATTAGVGLNNQADTVDIYHNTMDSNSAGVAISGTPAAISIRNNLFTNNTGAAISDSGVTAPDFNGYSGNGANCSGCAIGANAVLADPDYTNAANGDFTLQPGSPAIDRGEDLGVDMNGMGGHNGLAPDLGALETP